MSRHRDIPTYMLIAGCGAFGLIIALELLQPGPAELPLAGTSTAPEHRPAPHHPDGGKRQELLTTILDRPLFSVSRRPAEVAAAPAATADLKGIRLTAITTEPGWRVATFDVTGARPLTLTEGETVNGWLVETITPDQVTLSGPEGSKRLQPKTDPAIVRAHSQPNPLLAHAKPGLPATPATVAAAPPAAPAPVPAPQKVRLDAATPPGDAVAKSSIWESPR